MTKAIANREENLIVANLDKARTLLAAAQTHVEVKKIIDTAHVAGIYARQQKLSEECIGYAHSIKMEATALLGRHLKAMPKNEGGRPKTSSKKEEVSRATIPQLGINHKLSSDAQLLADVADKKPELFEQIKSGKAKINHARREMQVEKKTAELNAKTKKAEQSANKSKSKGECPWRLIQGDCITELGKLKDRPRLIFADPPYNVGVDYGDGEKKDKLPADEFIAWGHRWIEKCNDILADDGSFWLLISDEFAAEYCLILKSYFTIRSWIKWYETFGVNCSNKFNRCSRHLFYCVKDAKRFVFNRCPAIMRPSDRQTEYNDKRANPDGKIWDDVWEIPRLVGTAKERIDGFPTQLPLDLLRPIVQCTAEPGDLILDPFNGSATTGVAALEHNCKYIGIELREPFLKLASARLTRAHNEKLIV